MTQVKGRDKSNRPPKRSARGFLQAGGLIGSQLCTVQARQGFAQARLKALWQDIAGTELAGICWPEKLTSARGPAGGLLKLAVGGAHGPQVQMMLPMLRDRINTALGPGTVGRIQLVNATLRVPRSAPAPSKPETQPSDPLPETIASALSSIGDDELRDVLKTLARNVLSRDKDRTIRKTHA
jgi:hypothetical protein